MFSRSLVRNTNAFTRLAQAPSTINTQRRSYGLEVNELLHHVRAGHFSERGVSREVVDDCTICQTFPADHARIAVMHKMNNTWDKQWAALYEAEAVE
jgi:hypothetical protein